MIFEFHKHDLHPNDVEESYLSALYSRFFSIHEKFSANTFWSESPSQRLFLIKEIFSIYNECCKYEPINKFLKSPEFPIINNPFLNSLFINLRHILLHFPVAESWDDIKFKKTWLTAFEKTSRIEKFMNSYKGWEHSATFKTPFEPKEGKLVIKIPDAFFDDEIVFLKEIVNEKSGVTFAV